MKGRLRQRKVGGSWEICIDIGKDPATGKRLRHFEIVKGPKRNAQQRLNELLHNLDTGNFVKPSKLTLGQFLLEWLRDYAKPNTAPKTFERYAEIVKGHLIPALGSVAILSLQPQQIQQYYARALESGRRDGKGGLSALTVKKHHRILFEALRHGVRQDILVRNPAEAVSPPRGDSKEVIVVGADHLQLILNAAEKTPYYALFFTAAYTGMRRGELLGLRWCDLDINKAQIDKAQLSVVQSLQQLRDGQYILREPKSKRSRRQVALAPNLVVKLWNHRVKQEYARKLLEKPLAPTDLVFSHPDGKPFRPNSISRALKLTAESLGLKGVRFHDLRHTHATIMLQQGTHPKIVQERLGHSSISTTLDIYSHVMPGLQEEAALKFESALPEVKL